MQEPIAPEPIARLFTDARTFSHFLPEPVSEATLRRLYELSALAPTGGNSNPMRLLFVQSKEAKERLRPTLSPGNVDKTMSAPVTAIVAYDSEFYEKMDRLFPMRDMRPTFRADRAMADRSGFMNGALSAGYLILAARALGLDCGPMAGFDNAKVDAEFFAGGTWRSIVLVNLGYGDRARLFPRLPRLSFEESCRIE